MTLVTPLPNAFFGTTEASDANEAHHHGVPLLTSLFQKTQLVAHPDRYVTELGSRKAMKLAFNTDAQALAAGWAMPKPPASGDRFRSCEMRPRSIMRSARSNSKLYGCLKFKRQMTAFTIFCRGRTQRNIVAKRFGLGCG